MAGEVREISPWDVLVFPDGRRRYRFNTDNAKLPLETQIHAVGSPEYRNEVLAMREQVRAWHKKYETVDLGHIVLGMISDYDGQDGFK